LRNSLPLYRRRWSGTHDQRDVLQLRDDPPAGLVADRTVLRPAGRDIGDRPRVTVIPHSVAALVSDQIDLHEPRRRVVPVSPGRAATQTSAASGSGSGTSAANPAWCGCVREAASWPDRERADGPSSPRHADQQHRSLLGDLQLVQAPQSGRQLAHDRHQPLAVRGAEHRPTERQRGHNLLVVPRCPRPARTDQPRPPAPYGHGCDANRSSRTTRPEITPLAALSAGTYRVAIALVTALRWPIVSPHRPDLPARTTPAR